MASRATYWVSLRVNNPVKYTKLDLALRKKNKLKRRACAIKWNKEHKELVNARQRSSYAKRTRAI
jgi:hypothetical protein